MFVWQVNDDDNDDNDDNDDDNPPYAVFFINLISNFIKSYTQRAI